MVRCSAVAGLAIATAVVFAFGAVESRAQHHNAEFQQVARGEPPPALARKAGSIAPHRKWRLKAYLRRGDAQVRNQICLRVRLIPIFVEAPWPSARIRNGMLRVQCQSRCTLRMTVRLCIHAPCDSNATASILGEQVSRRAIKMLDLFSTDACLSCTCQVFWVKAGVIQQSRLNKITGNGTVTPHLWLCHLLL